jgi:hypothetical protein
MKEVRKVVGGFPPELANELITGGHANYLPLVRGGSSFSADVIVSGVQIAATMVTFAQVPETIQYLAKVIRTWRKKADTGMSTLTVTSPKGNLRLELTEETSAADIEAILRLLG